MEETRSSSKGRDSLLGALPWTPLDITAKGGTLRGRYWRIREHRVACCAERSSRYWAPIPWPTFIKLASIEERADPARAGSVEEKVGCAASLKGMSDRLALIVKVGKTVTCIEALGAHCLWSILGVTLYVIAANRDHRHSSALVLTRESSECRPEVHNEGAVIADKANQERSGLFEVARRDERTIGVR